MIRGNNTGERIKNRREELGLSQTELAKRMGYSSKSAISRTENAGDDVGMTRVYKFAQALSCKPTDLAGWVNEPANLYAPISHKRATMADINRKARVREVKRKLHNAGIEQLETELEYLDASDLERLRSYADYLIIKKRHKK